LPEDKDNGTLKSCNLLQIFDELSVLDDKCNQETFRDEFSTALKSRTKTHDEAALLLAMSLAHSSLDSEWFLEPNTRSAVGRSLSTNNSIGEREGLLPWMKCTKTQSDVFDSYNSDEDATSLGRGSY